MSDETKTGMDHVFDDYCDTLRVLRGYASGGETLAERAKAACDEIERLKRSEAFHVEACGAHQRHIDELQAEFERLKSERNSRYDDWQIEKTARINADAEIERLGRCNESINRTMSEIINKQNSEIERLQELSEERHSLYVLLVGSLGKVYAENERLRDQVAMLSDPHRLAESLTEFVRQQADPPRHSDAKLDALAQMVKQG